ncbi:MAG: hypothetical protein AB1743_01140 [Actinomycetota bacterium]
MFDFLGIDGDASVFLMLGIFQPVLKPVPKATANPTAKIATVDNTFLENIMQ